MLLVQLWINSTRDVWKFAKLDSPRRLVQFWQNFQTSLVLLIPNCTRHRMITYTYLQVKDETSAGCRKPFVTQFLIPSTGVIGMTSYRLILFFHINVMTSRR